MSVPVVRLWSGRETRLLRESMRLSIRDFAARICVSERMVSTWEERAEKHIPRPANQKTLDLVLHAAEGHVKARFWELMGEQSIPVRPVSTVAPDAVPEAPLLLDARKQVRHPIDGKLMILVDEGVALLGPQDEPMYVPGFYIDVFPTTNADYARFVAATGHRAPQHWTSSAPPPGELLNHPVVFVTWRDAAAYAAWSAKILPSAQQWEKAARGARGDVYPWGSQLTPAKCNVRESDRRATTPVDCYHSGVSPYGVYDLCGNCWEWCSTPTENGRYELKGSAFTSPFFRATPSNFNDASADMLDDDTSFRCATPAETMRALLTMNGASSRD